jgi:isopentenyl-diphosphate delta-isomerase
MTLDFAEFEQRKRDHIQLAMDPIHQTSGYNRFDDYALMHEAIPDINFSDVQILMQSCLPHWNKPFFISSMTAGHAHAATINHNLLAACSMRQWAMGVGSQRREIEDLNASKEWINLRRSFPHVMMMANLGLAQLITTPIDMLKRLVESIDASAFIIHCNPLQEVIQPEGTPNFKGSWQALEKFTQDIGIPVIVKETGCGFSISTIQRLNELGVYAIDVSGLGGTHWGRIEGSRVIKNEMLSRTAKTFANWGISTADVLADTKHLSLQCELWGSGGIRHGLDAAKGIALGAKRIGIAQPVLKAAMESVDQVLSVIDVFEYELKVAMFCSGCVNLDLLAQAPMQSVF